MFRLIFYAVILILLRAVGREALGGRARRAADTSGRGAGVCQQRGVQMARDPVCGTFVIPEQAIVLTTGSQRLYFCSTECRDKYRAQSNTDPIAQSPRSA